MNVIEKRIETLNDLVNQVESHCMCLSLEEINGRYVVIYPEGYFPEGVQCWFNGCKSEALRKILTAMERHWKESFGNSDLIQHL